MHIAHETAGAARTRSSLRPLLFGGGVTFANLGRRASREREVISIRRPALPPGAQTAPPPPPALRQPLQGLGAPARGPGRRDERFTRLQSRPAKCLQHALLGLRRLGIG